MKTGSVTFWLRGIAWPALLLIGQSLMADDRVVVQPSGQSSRVTIGGRITDFNGRELVLHTGVGTTATRRIPRAEVVSVSTQFQEEHEAAKAALDLGDLDAADAHLAAALEAEDRKWVRREILAAQVRVALRRGDLKRAASRFLPIVESDEQTFHFGLIPLVWSESNPSSATEAEGKSMLRHPLPAAQLIGASWLLNGNSRAEGEAILQRLAREPLPEVQQLAQAQLWRPRLSANDVSGREIERWQHFVEALPAELRAGPLFLIGRGSLLQQDHLAAAASFLWLPSVYAERYDLAAEAQFLAATALAEAGDREAAIRLADELGVRYSSTRWAVEIVSRRDAWAVRR